MWCDGLGPMNLSEQPNQAGLRFEFIRFLARPVIPCLLLVAVTLAVYWPVVHCDFVNFDDGFYFSANSHVQAGLNRAGLAWAFTTIYADNWHPMTWVSLMLDETLFGRGPAGPHLTNLVLHAANAVLLFLLLRSWLGSGPGQGTGPAATWQSAVVAVLFALHPLHVESVAWIAERKDVLSAFFGLLTLLCYTSYARRVTDIEDTAVAPVSVRVARHASRFYGLALVCFALGLMSKSMLVTLPLVMLLLDWWPLNRVPGARCRVSGLRRLVVEKIPFFLLSAAACVVTFIAQQKGGAVASLLYFSVSERIGNAFVSYARYLGKAFWPAVLATPYPHPGHWPPWLVLLATTLFVGLGVLAVAWIRKHPYVPVGWFWFVGMLVPVIGLVQVGDAALADRYTYLPLIGIFLVVVRGAGELCANRPAAGTWLGLGAALVLAACAWRTRIQVGYWQDSGTLFRHALAVTENNYAACNNLGTWLTRHNVFIEAENCFRESLRIKPGNPDALYNLGNINARFGRWDEAIDDYRRALQITPDQPDILTNLGLALTARGQLAEATINFEASLKLDPDSASVHNNLGTVLLMEHHVEEAARHFREAYRLAPDNSQICANLGDVLVRLGQISEAAKHYEEALQLNPADAKTEGKLRALGAKNSN